MKTQKETGKINKKGKITKCKNKQKKFKKIK